MTLAVVAWVAIGVLAALTITSLVIGVMAIW